MASMHPSENMKSMFPGGGGYESSRHDPHHVETKRAMDPHSSIEDYNRIMLEYTQRRMSTFMDLDDGNSSGVDSPNSQSSSSTKTSGSGSSNSTSGVLARQSNVPTSASSMNVQRGSESGHKPSKDNGTSQEVLF